MAAAILATLVAWAVVGVFGAAYGADDNGDGLRLTCPSALVPNTPSGQSRWQGGVVLHYTVDKNAPCREGPAYPSSRRVLLDLLVPDSGTFSMRRLAAAESAIFGVVVGAGVFLWRRWGAAGAWAAALVTLAALAPVMARFYLSPYSETAGLVGAVALLFGIGGILANSARHRGDRIGSFLLVAFGGLYGGLAKQANVLLLVLAVVTLLCAVPFAVDKTAKWWLRAVPRVVSAAVCAVLVTFGVNMYNAGEDWADSYAVKQMTTYDFVLGTVALEMRKSGVPYSELGLPDSLKPLIGKTQWPDGPRRTQPDWVQYMLDEGDDTRGRATKVVVKHPEVALRMMLQATRSADDVDVPYLAPNARGKEYEKGALREALDSPYELNGRVFAAKGGQVGLLILLLAAAAAPVRLAVRWRMRGRAAAFGAVREDPADAMLVFGSLAALLALGTGAVSVWGDGYYELAKHFWLGSYFSLLAVSLTLSVCVVGAGRAIAKRRAARA